MTGKPDIGQGQAHGFYPRLEKQHAELQGTNPAPIPTLPPDFVEGPFSTKRKKYWIQRERGLWFVWLDVLAPRRPHARDDLQEYLDDPANAEFAPGIRRKARSLGWP